MRHVNPMRTSNAESMCAGKVLAKERLSGRSWWFAGGYAYSTNSLGMVDVSWAAMVSFAGRK